MPAPPNDRDRPLGKGGPVSSTTATNGEAIVADRRLARRRLAREHARLRIAALAHAAMPLDAYYRCPRNAFYSTLTEGRWAA